MGIFVVLIGHLTLTRLYPPRTTRDVVEKLVLLIEKVPERTSLRLYSLYRAFTQSYKAHVFVFFFFL